MKNIFRKISLSKIVLICLVVLVIGLGIHFVNHYKQLPRETVITAPTTTKSISLRAEEYLAKGDTQGIEDLRTYVAQNPNDPQGYKYYGIILSSNGEYEKSNEQLNLILADDDLKNRLTTPDLSIVYYFLGRNNQVLEQNDLAENNFNRALELNPNCYQCYDGLAVIAKQNGDYEKALVFLDKELPLPPNTNNDPLLAYPYYHSAECYYYLEQYEKAQEMIDKADSLSQLLTQPVPRLFLDKIKDLKLQINAKINQ